MKCAQLEFECVMPVVDIELAGFYMHKDRWLEQLGIVEKRRSELAEQLQQVLAEESLQGSLFGGPQREDINLDAVFRVAWKNDTVAISDKALQRIAECRASFLKLLESDPPPIIYGVTTAMGELASRKLERDERDRHARIKAFAAATSFGEPLPERVVRAIGYGADSACVAYSETASGP